MASLKYEDVAEELELTYSLRTVRIARQYYRQHFTKEIKNYQPPFWDGLRLIALDLRLDYQRKAWYASFTNNHVYPENHPDKVLEFWKKTGIVLRKGNYSKVNHPLELIVKIVQLSVD